MKKILTFAALISVITLVAFWGTRKACMMMWPGSLNPSQQWYFNLGLSPEQAQSLKRMDSLFRKDTDKFCMWICKERLELLNLIRNNAAPELVYKKIEEIGMKQVSLEKEIAAHILKVKQDLSPEQRDAYLDRIREELQDSIRQAGFSEALSQ